MSFWNVLLSVEKMAMEYKSYADFVKSVLHAVPMTVAEPQMVLGAVLEKSSLTQKFQRVGNLRSLCAATADQQKIQSELANLETLDYPFGKERSYDFIQGFWKSKSSGFLGMVIPNTAEVQAWMKEYKFVKFQVSGISCHYLKDEYLVDIINNGKWQPNMESLKDFYTIHEIVLATEIKFRLSKGAGAGAGAEINVLNPLPVPAVGAGLAYSQNGDDSFTICGVMENGQRKPFPIAFRAVHIKLLEEDEPHSRDRDARA